MFKIPELGFATSQLSVGTISVMVVMEGAIVHHGWYERVLVLFNKKYAMRIPNK